MTLDSRERKLALRLAVLTREAGVDGLGEVKAGLERVVAGQPLAWRRAFLRAYRRYLEREVRRHELRVQRAGPVSEATLRDLLNSFSARVGHRLTLVTEENPALLGGLRVIHGDNVYDASLAGRLTALQQSVQ